MRLRIEWLGRVPYAEAHARQELLAARIAGDSPDTLLLCEHDPVYTLGRSRGASANVLQAGDVPVVNVERGGDVTFHGPGQLVGYPICGLPEHRHDLHAWLHGLEDVCVRPSASGASRVARTRATPGCGWRGGRSPPSASPVGAG